MGGDSINYVVRETNCCQEEMYFIEIRRIYVDFLLYGDPVLPEYTEGRGTVQR